MGDIEPKRVRLDETIHEDPIPIKQFENSVTIFDGVDVITGKRIRDAVCELLNQVLEIGRRLKITCLMTNHLIGNRNDTRRLLNECHICAYFPRSSSSTIKYVLSE